MAWQCSVDTCTFGPVQREGNEAQTLLRSWPHPSLAKVQTPVHTVCGQVVWAIKYKRRPDTCHRLCFLSLGGQSLIYGPPGKERTGIRQYPKEMDWPLALCARPPVQSFGIHCRFLGQRLLGLFFLLLGPNSQSKERKRCHSVWAKAFFILMRPKQLCAPLPSLLGLGHRRIIFLFLCRL